MSAEILGLADRLAELALDFQTCIPFLPIHGRKNIAARIETLQQIAAELAARLPDEGCGLVRQWNCGGSWEACSEQLYAILSARGHAVRALRVVEEIPAAPTGGQQ